MDLKLAIISSIITCTSGCSLH